MGDAQDPKGGWGSHPDAQGFFSGLFSRVLGFVLSRVGALLALGALVVLTVQIAWCRAQDSKLAAKAAEAQTVQAKLEKVLHDFDAVQGTLIRERQAHLTPTQKKFVAAVKKADPKAELDSVGHVDVKIEDQAGAIETPAGSPCPSRITDTYGRFTFDLPNGPLYRKQKFGLDFVTLRGADGTYRVQKFEIREYNPTTGEEISNDGVDAKAHFEFREQDPEGPSPWHMRGVAAFAFPVAYGGGIQFNPWRGLTLGPLFMFQPATKDRSAGIVAGLGVGWRILGSTISVGPYAGVSSQHGAFVGGAFASIEVTR